MRIYPLKKEHTLSFALVRVLQRMIQDHGGQSTYRDGWLWVETTLGHRDSNGVPFFTVAWIRLSPDRATVREHLGY